MDAPQVDPPVRDVGMEFRTDIGHTDPVEIDAETLPEPVAVIRCESVVRLEPSVDPRIRVVVNRDAVRLLPRKRRQYPFP